ncbi:MAG: hypothetical protein ACI9XC_002159 [Gammaproteobacteria bacterium]|jgi:hypothetical protein
MKILSNNKSWSVFTLVYLLFTVCNVVAHTDNETTLFPDIKTIDARFDVILLVSIGIIPVTENYHPEDRLSRLDLAAWATLATGLAEAGVKPMIKSLADIALTNGLIDTVDGDASYADINKVLFNGFLSTDSSKVNPTRADAAKFIAANLSNGIKGETLLEKRGMYFGPTGKVSSVETRTNPDGSTSYFITIANETYPMYPHGKLANGPTDLKLWQDKNVRRSVIRNLGQFKLWVFLEAGDESHADHQHSH